MTAYVNILGFYRRIGSRLLPSAERPDGNDVLLVCKIYIKQIATMTFVNQACFVATNGEFIYSTRVLWNGEFEIIEDAILDDMVVIDIFEAVKSWLE